MLLMTALALLYASAVFLLLLSAWWLSVPLSLVVAWLLLLFHEGWHLALAHSQDSGRIQLFAGRKLHWQGQDWLLVNAKICTAWIMVFKVRGAAGSRWLVIAPDRCDFEAYRSLALFGRYPDALDG